MGVSSVLLPQLRTEAHLLLQVQPSAVGVSLKLQQLELAASGGRRMHHHPVGCLLVRHFHLEYAQRLPVHLEP